MLLAWIDQGCAKGDDKDLPEPAKFPAGWRIGKPDVVFPMPEEFKVPATGVLPYQRFSVDPGFKEDRWVQAAEARPGNRKVVHHIVVYIQVPGQAIYQKDGTTALLVGWAPGDMPAKIADFKGEPPPKGGPPGVYAESGGTAVTWVFPRVQLF